MLDASVRRVVVHVTGTVQGVGFRPFVHRAATELALLGTVGNDDHGVVIDATGPAHAVDELLRRLDERPPALAVVTGLTVTDQEAATPHVDFRIVASTSAADTRTTDVAPDAATCPDCLAEVLDPADRRHRHALANCTNCGPRLSIVVTTPYDRPNTTMAGFAMCDDCRAEYRDPTNRRFHAQPTCCPACGPTLSLHADGQPVPGDPIEGAARLLRDGQIVAVKGLGGWHLAALATSMAATATLRSRKHREDKPFAVMVGDVATARRLCHVDATTAARLGSAEAPIVLLRRRARSASPSDDDVPDHDLPDDDVLVVADAVAPGNRWLGLMLPSTPLHHLLAAAVDAPLVLTSGNVSDEPIAIDDDDAHARLGSIADAFLGHARPIQMRVEDSVERVVDGQTTVLRRSRGHAPRPIELAVPARSTILAVGAHLKSTFCLADGHRAILSPHLGDLGNAAAWSAFVDGIAHFQRLFDLSPAVVAHDLHPDLLSTQWATEWAAQTGLPLIGVQHHHAHIASCLVDNGHQGPVIGVAFDGTGYGPDATVWGGEVLVADLHSFERVGHLEAVAMPGATAAIVQPWRMAAAWLDAIGRADDPLAAVTALRDRAGDRWRPILAMARTGTNAPVTSSCGRLFDAVAALLDVRDTVTYEGQAAIELEQLADRSATDPATETPATSDSAAVLAAVRAGNGDVLTLRGGDLVACVLDDLAAGLPRPVVARRFHHRLAAIVVAACDEVRGRTGLGTVACSGGVFQNVLLTGDVVAGLTAAGFEVLTHHRIPPNDGGIAIGQAAIAAARQSLAVVGPRARSVSSRST